MPVFVFDWTKKEFILTALSVVLLVLTMKHKEFFLCEEKPLTTFEKFCVWVGVMEKPTPCPGIDDLYTMAMEMGVASVAIVGTSLLPSLWKWTRSLLGAGMAALKGLTQSLKGCVQNVVGGATQSIRRSFEFLKGCVRSRGTDAFVKNPPEYKYFFFRNAYEQRRILMFMREGDRSCEIFVQNPQSKKMECVLSYQKGN